MLSNFFGILFLIGICILGIIFIGSKLVTYADELSKATGMSQAFIGFILIAAITSMPEMISTFVAANQGLYDLVAGGIFGSNMVNLAIFSAICLIFKKNDIVIHKNSVFSFMNSLVLLSFVGFFMVYHIISIVEINRYLIFLIIMSFYICIMYYTFKFHQEESRANIKKNEQKKETSLEASHNLPVIITYFSLSAIGIITVSWGMVYLCDLLSTIPIPFIGNTLGQHFIGTLILAVATSIPELSTTTQLIRRGNINMGIENISGSNVFNLIVLVVASLIAKENIWIVMPYNSMFTIFGIFIASLMINMLALIKHSNKMAITVYTTVVLLWILSLKLVF